MTIDELQRAIADFARERDWEQFHSPKNLAIALSVEAAELMEPFQWLTQAESSDTDALDMEQIRNEIGDVLIYLLRLADRLEIDVLEAAERKLIINHRKYPADRVRGSAKKYTEYGDG